MPRRKQTKRTTVKDLRTILRLAHEHGLSMRAISERLRLSKTSVATYLWRAREAGLSSYPNRSRLQLAVAMLTVLNRTAPNGARRERILIRVLFSRRNPLHTCRPIHSDSAVRASDRSSRIGTMLVLGMIVRS
jgi:hypothetical protein